MANKRDLSDIKCIVVHNTSNYEMNAQELKNYLKTDNSTRMCHYLVDDKEILEVVPLDEIAWNTGVAFDYGNLYGIAIEIVSKENVSEYLIGEQKAVDLIKELMERFNLTKEDIFFHRDFCRDINCPANILQIYGNKKNFIDKYFGG